MRIASASVARASMLAFAGCAVLSADPAVAQTPSAAPADTAPGAQLEEILVTAQKRTENLQDVPMSIAVLDGAALRAAGASNLDNIKALVPGYQGPGDAGNSPPHIRGIGSQTLSPGNESAVAYYIDGIYISTLNRALIDLNDIAQIEVLKGPQGTLFGRNSTGGLVSITTRSPGDHLEAEAEAGYANYRTVSGSLYVGGPVSERVSADFALQSAHQGEGWGRNLYDGRDTAQDDLDLSLRSRWVLRLAESTTLQLIADYERNRTVGLTTTRPVTGEGSLFGPITPSPAGWDINEDALPTETSRAYGLTARLEQGLGFATLTSLTGYRNASSTNPALDADGTPLTLITVVYDPTNWQVSEELQLASPTGGAVEWTGGLYYYRAQDALNLVESYGPILQPVTGFQGQSALAQQRTDSYSAYAQGSYAFTESTRATLGGRYTRERRSLHQEQSFTLLDGTDVTGAQSSPATAPREISTENNVVTWRAALDQKLSQSVLAYVSASRGFKSGGFNLSSFTNPAFKPETLTAYEAGVKSTLLDRRLRLNGEVFHYDYQNIQVSQIAGTFNVLYNGPSARVNGVDADADLKVTERFSLNAGAEWLHAVFGPFPNAVLSAALPMGGYSQTAGSATGNHLPQAPDFSASFTPGYSVPTTLGRFDLASTYSYNAGYFTEPDNRLRQSAYSLLSASVLYTAPAEHFTLRLWGRNLTNAQVAEFLQTSTLSTLERLNAPRTYGVTFGYKY